MSILVQEALNSDNSIEDKSEDKSEDKTKVCRKNTFVKRASRIKMASRWLLILMFICPTILGFSATLVLAQSPLPSPTPTPTISPTQGTTSTASNPQQQVRNLTNITVQLVPAVKRIVESAMLRRYTFLATVVAQIIMLIALIKLQAEKPGATKEFFAQSARFIIILPLITLGPWLISYLYTLGYQLASPLRTPLEASTREFDESYYRFTMGMFTATDRGGVYQPMPTGTDAIVGVLSDKDSSVKTVDQMIDPAKWDMTKLFTGLTITRGIISFASFILIILTGFLMIAFKLAVPWMIAMSLDKSLAHEVTYKFARGVIVYTLVFPIVFHIISIIAFKIGTLGMAIYDGTPMYNVDPQTAAIIARPDVDPTFCFGVAVFMMAVAALCLVASPVISWKIAFGQTFEGIASVASGWMAAIVGSGINFLSARVGASLNNMAEKVQIEGQASAGLISAQAELSSATKSNAAALHNQLGSIASSRVGTILSYNAAAQREQSNLLSAYRNSVANIQINKQAQLGLIDADRGQSNRTAQNQAAREQSQAKVNAQIGSNNVEQSWWTWGTEAVSTVGTGNSNAGNVATRPGQIMTDSNNVEIQAGGTIGISSDNLSRTNTSNNTYAQDRSDIETSRASQTESALATQYHAQSGAVSTWNAQVNNAANVQAQIAAKAATESKTMMDDAARGRYVGAQDSISTIRSAGLQAAEYHRMAQIIGQVSHDITRRIEEMGQYHF